MNDPSFHRWRESFLNVIQKPEVAAPLKTASLAEDLKIWTACLTAAVVESCRNLGWLAAAKRHRLDELPKPGQEYLNMDVMAFANSKVTSRWRLPIAAFELENHPSDRLVAYSLWKVLCLRTELRVVFAFRRDWEKSRRSVEAIGQDVVGSLTAIERMAIGGETALIIGNRGDGDSFPWGYFKMWILDTNIGRFDKIS